MKKSSLFFSLFFVALFLFSVKNTLAQQAACQVAPPDQCLCPAGSTTTVCPDGNTASWTFKCNRYDRKQLSVMAFWCLFACQQWTSFQLFERSLARYWCQTNCCCFSLLQKFNAERSWTWPFNFQDHTIWPCCCSLKLNSRQCILIAFFCALFDKHQFCCFYGVLQY